MRSANNTFKRTFALAAAAALLVASRPAESRALGAPPQNVPFTISSLGTPFGVQVKFEGTYTVNETYVEVNVERALIYVSEHCPYQGRRYVSSQVGELLAQSFDRDPNTALHTELSDREFQVFLRLAKGATVSDIGNALSLSIKTVSTYRTRIMEKMGLQSNSDLTYYAMKNNLLD